jgi:adenylosuccinate lyase
MLKNLEKMGGLIFSETILLLLARKGLSREQAYEIVQRNAMKVWEEGGDFKSILSKDEVIKNFLTEDELNSAFNIKNHLKHVDDIFKRVFGDK